LECPSCNTQLAPDARFCQRCGAAIAVTPTELLDPLRESLKAAIGRQYEVIRLLGKGGMGAVYLAREAALERDVAIKILPPDRGDTQESRERFRREARTAARLSHPNIVPLHTFGEVDGTLYFVMGYVKGESLASRLKREGKLPVEEARRILIEIAEALEYAHKVGIVHRDIKPDNVLIEEGTSRAMLTDFGIAKSLGAGQTMTTVGSVLGTPHYMSPEQAQGKAEIDGRSDLYSLGVMGYAMLAGRLPFEGATPADVMAQHITKEAPSLAAIAPGTPEGLSVSLGRCLAKDPQQRWEDAGSLARSLAPTEAGGIPADMVGMPTWTQVVIGTVLLSGLIEMQGTAAIPHSDPNARFAMTAGRIFEMITALVFAGWLLVLCLCRHKGRPWSDILRFAFAKPPWWAGAYPARLRLPGDVWLRLPPVLRRARVFFWIMLLFLGFVLIGASYRVGSLETYRRTGQWPPVSRLVDQIPMVVWGPLRFLVIAAYFANLAGLVYYWSGWRRSRLSSANGLLWGDTGDRSFWRRPEIAALLLPEASADGPPSAPPTVPELASAICDAVLALNGQLAPLGAKIRDSARALADSVPHWTFSSVRLRARWIGRRPPDLRERSQPLGRLARPRARRRSRCEASSRSSWTCFADWRPVSKTSRLGDPGESTSSRPSGSMPSTCRLPPETRRGREESAIEFESCSNRSTAPRMRRRSSGTSRRRSSTSSWWTRSVSEASTVCQSIPTTAGGGGRAVGAFRPPVGAPGRCRRGAPDAPNLRGSQASPSCGGTRVFASAS
jgi:predicted Ser/Thr protein kinase